MLPFKAGLENLQEQIALENRVEAQRILDTMEFPSEKACRYWYAQFGLEPSPSVLAEQVLTVAAQEYQVHHPEYHYATNTPKPRSPVWEFINTLMEPCNFVRSGQNAPGRWL